MRITWSARAAFSSWGSWRLLAPREPGLAALGEPALPNLVVGDHGQRSRRRRPHPGLEQQRHLDHGDLGAGVERLAPREHLLADARVKLGLEPGELLGLPKTISATFGAVDLAAGSDLGRPSARPALADDIVAAEQLVGDRSVERVAAPSRAAAASASDLPAPIPPVRPMKRVKRGG